MTETTPLRFYLPAGGLLLLVMVPFMTKAADEHFSPTDILSWHPHSFEGETRYELVDVDGRTAIHAVCDEATPGTVRSASCQIEIQRGRKMFIQRPRAYYC